MTSTLARPRSPSSSITRLPSSAIDTARLTDTEVLPTPPLPLVTATTCTGLGARRRRRPAAWLPPRSFTSLCGMDGSELQRQRGVVDPRRRRARELHRTQHQRVRTTRFDVLGNALAVAAIGDRQLVADHRRQRATDAQRQIGRASCRERVCQYVELEGGPA